MTNDLAYYDRESITTVKMSIAQTTEKIKCFLLETKTFCNKWKKKVFLFEVKHLFDDKIPSENYTRPLVGATTLCKMALSIMTLYHLLSVILCSYSECRYAECHNYA